MQITASHPGNNPDRHLISRESGAELEERVVKSHCWYCNKPLYIHRNYCSTECREAMYEDNEHARQRRMIFGCQC
ncbi:DUF2116 family Zn-ribbon domain-containing protein [Noviherbaspirillum sedimenti]|uniref:DUF2116 family Zn-ribbon domain-containing protein n=1 Tax=Noviherbaspirillum sedimenti TaxID=2320865 RepID=UPI0011C3A8A4|nr:hypothetical protein [Noviherbaspirillum sedimenti]